MKSDETEIIVSGEVSRIKSECFSNYNKIQKVEIQDGVLVIDDRAFINCTNLKSITIPNSIWRLGLQVFQNCINLQDIRMSNNVKVLNYKVFKNCKSLKKILLPGVVGFSGPTIFEGCDSLEAVVAPNIVLENTIAAYKPLLMAGFIESPENFSEEKALKFKKYILSQKKKLISVWLKNDYLPGIKFLAENGAITVGNFDSIYFLPAQTFEAKQCVAYLMDWKNQSISIDDELKYISRVLNRKPTEISAFKQFWEYDTFKDGTIALTRYLGNETDIIIPAKVGKYTIFRLNKNVFKSCTGGNIKNVFIPKSVTEIRRTVFEDEPDVTIHAPAGSYAEQYAKENKIPFVAEDK